MSNVKGITWGLDNKDAESPEGWRDELLEFSKYGGPGRCHGKANVVVTKTCIVFEKDKM